MKHDLIVLLPGIMGSALKKDGKMLWDLSAGAGLRALLSGGGSIKELTPTSDSSTGDGVTATHLLANAHMIPYLWKIDGYSGFAKYVQDVFNSVPGEDFVEFPYDWRLDNRHSAAKLKATADEWLEARRSRYGRDVRLILVAHSMGGLVARYFLERLDGWKDTRWLITLGTPHRGSVKALDFLVNGLRKKIGPLILLDLSAFVQACPSVYQLLPIYPCVGNTEQDLERLEELAEKEDRLGGLDLRMAKAGVEFHREIEGAVDQNRRSAKYREKGYELLPIVGTFQPTFQSAVIDGDGVRPLYSYKGESMLEGDGTVPRLSATPIEFSGSKAQMFASCPHAGLQNFAPVRVQLRAVLQDDDISLIKAAAHPEPVALKIDDLFSSSDPFHAQARCRSVFEPMLGTLHHLETDSRTDVAFGFEDDNGWQHLELPPLEPGTYRLQVEPNPYLDPVTDVFAVV